MGFANQVTRVVTDFLPDPNNPSRDIAADMTLRVQGQLVAPMVGGDLDPGLQFFGYSEALQDFKGLAVGTPTSSVMRDGAADLSDAVTANPMGDPARRIFADRLRRRLA